MRFQRSLLAGAISLLLLTFLVLPAGATKYPVPQEGYDEIGKVLHDLADPGDTLDVLNHNPNDPSSPYQPFVMESGVWIIAHEGQTPIIDGSDTVATVVDWPAAAADTTILRGFTIRGGTDQVVFVRGEGKIQNCVVENGGAGYADHGIRSTGDTEISGCTVSMTGDQTNHGIYQIDGVATISNCVISVDSGTNRWSNGIFTDSDPTGHIDACEITMAKGTGIYTSGGDVRIQGCTVDVTQYDEGYNFGITCHPTPTGSDSVVVSDCFVTAKDAVGINIEVEKVEVKNCTIYRVDTGIWGTGGNEKVHHCIVSQSNYAGYQGCAFDDVNAEYCIAYPSSEQSCAYESGSQGTGSVREDPLFCDATGGEFTLRVDSYGNPQNADNPDDTLIGARPVACMYGTLARCSTWGGGSLDVLGDTTIPEDSTLTLTDDADLVVADTDNQSAGGDHNEVQVNVIGSLIANGSSGHEAVWRSATATAGTWDGIVIPDDAAGAQIDLTYGIIRDAEYGILAGHAWGTVDVDHVTIQNCESYGVWLFTIAGGTHTLSGTGLTVDMDDAPIGVYLAGYQNTSLAWLAIHGNSNSINGLKLEAMPYSGGANPLFTHFSAYGLSQGSGVFVKQLSPEFQALNVSECKWGVYMQGSGQPRLQKESDDLGEISDCETGLYVTGQPSPDVDDLSILACTTGLFTDSLSTGTYTNVSIDSDGGTGSIGFYAKSSATHTFRHGVILDFDLEGVQVSPAGGVDLGTQSDSGNNYIYSSASPNHFVKCKNRVQGLGDVMAENNYWGSTNPPANMFSPSVDYDPWLQQMPPSSASEVAIGELPRNLFAVSPNPMRSETVVLFNVPADAKSPSLRIFDLNGRMVRDLLADRSPTEGFQRVVWDGRDAGGQVASSGVYFVRYRDSRSSLSQKIVRLP